MTTVEHREGEHVENGEVHIQKNAEPEHEAPTFRVLEEIIVESHDTDRSAEVTGFDVGLG